MIGRAGGVGRCAVEARGDQAADVVTGAARRRDSPEVSKASKRAAAAPGRRQPKRWTAEEKPRVVTSAASFEGSALGELLRREGLHEADLRSFREKALAGL